MKSQWVGFKGSIFVKVIPGAVNLGFSFATSGIILGAFGIGKLSLFNLVLKAEVAFPGPIPIPVSLTIGGGICLGTQSKCKGLFKQITGQHGARENLGEPGQPRTLGEGIVPDADGTLMPPMLFLDENKRPHTPKVPGAVAAALYAGFDLKVGDAFFYAAITKTSINDIAKAMVPTSRLPNWIGGITISGYDQSACRKCGGKCSACNAFMSFSSRGTTIKELTPPLVIPVGFALSGRIGLFGKSVGMKLVMSMKTFQGEFDCPTLKIGRGSRKLVLARSKTQRNKGPYLKMKYTVGSFKFEMAFQAYLEVPYLGSAAVSVLISPTVQRLSIKHLNILGFIKASGMVETGVGNGEGQSIKANLRVDVSRISVSLKKVANAAVKPITDLRNAVNKVFDSINGRLTNAKNKLNSAQSKLHSAKRSCDHATNKLNSKKRSCPREESLYLGEGSSARVHVETVLGVGIWRRRRKDDRRRRFFKKVGKFVKKTAKRAVKVVKKTAGQICRGALGALARAADEVCKAPMNFASSALQVAQRGLNSIQKIVNNARAVVNNAAKTALDVIKFLQSAKIKELGFNMAGVNPQVNFWVTMLINNAPRKYNFGFQLQGGSMTTIVKSLFKAVFEAIKAAAMNTLKKLRKQILGFEEEAAEAERRMETEMQAAMEEAREMERERLAEAAEDEAIEKQLGYV